MTPGDPQWGSNRALAEWDVTNFGNLGAPPSRLDTDDPSDPPPGDPSGKSALAVDRYGREGAYATPLGERFFTTPLNATGSEIDYSFSEVIDHKNAMKRALIAVAPGKMRGARMRETSCPANGTTSVGEIFVEHQVDFGWYAEHFVVAYRYLDDVNEPKKGTPWADGPDGSSVALGQTLGYVGTSCSGPNAWRLGFAVYRLTNMTGGYGYAFKAVPADPNAGGFENEAGVNGQHSVIDPYGWAVPNVADPWAHRYIGNSLDDFFFHSKSKQLVADLGAYSLNLWKGDPPPAQAPTIATGSNVGRPARSPSGFVNGSVRSALVLRDPITNHIRQLEWSESAWIPSDLTAKAGAPLAASDPSPYVRTDMVSAVLYRSTPDDHIIELSPGDASSNDLTAATAAPPAAGGPSAYRRIDNLNAVVYRGLENHIHELLGMTFKCPADKAICWSASDLSVAAGNSALATGNPAGYVRGDGVNAVVYRSGGDIHELELVHVNSWTDTNVSAKTNATAAQGDPSAFVRSDGQSAIVYLGVDSHIHELLWTGSVWGHWDLSACAKAPKPAASDPTGFVRADSANDVVYRAENDHVIELQLFPSCPNDEANCWLIADLTSVVNGSPAASGTPTGYIRHDDTSSIVYFGATNGHVDELAIPAPSTWSFFDLGP
jgi:hypothetical protein